MAEFAENGGRKGPMDRFLSMSWNRWVISHSCIDFVIIFRVLSSDH